MIGYFLRHPIHIVEALNEKGFHWLFGDRFFLKLIYKNRFGKKLNLKHPTVFTEKLQWMKLYDRQPIYTQMVDKYRCKELAASLIGSEYIVPTLGVWDAFDEIDFSVLPQQFVLKCTHDSGGAVICKDKATFEPEKAKAVIERALKRNYFYHSREWPYKDVKPRIIAEPYLEDSRDGELRDYKFFTFDGQPRYLYIAQGRGKTGETFADFYDMDFNHLDLKIDHETAPQPPHIPENFERMKELALKLSQGTKALRVDFYEVNGKVYLGELTLFHCSGFVPFRPPVWDEIWGKQVPLP